jgi:hypothetical protein
MSHKQLSIMEVTEVQAVDEVAWRSIHNVSVTSW